MQEVLIDDVLAVAAVLARVPSARKAWVLKRLFSEAAAADRHRRKVGRGHWAWGDGTLMAAAGRRGRSGPVRLKDPQFRATLMQVLRHLDTIYPRAQDTHIGCVGSASSRPGEISSPHSVQ